MWKSLSKFERFIAISLIVTVIVGQLFSFFPPLTQQFYTEGFFVISSRLLHFILGWIPFSVGDCLYVLVGVLVLRRIFKLIKKNSLKKGILWFKLFLLVSSFYVFFQWMWGFNYSKVSLHEQFHISSEYTTEELVEISEKLLHKTNSLQLKITGNESTKVEFPSDFNQMKNDVYKAFTSFENDTTIQLLPKTQNLKKSLISGPLTYMGFSGYINPFTNEAQVNSWIPASKWYVTSTHEIAHQLGYAKENEANFIATYVCTQQEENLAMQYAGYNFALRYCLGDLYYRNRDQFEYFYNCIHPGIIAEYQANNEFWEYYDNALEPLFKLIYGSYLVANDQPDGLETYSYVTALIVNHGLGLK